MARGMDEIEQSVDSVVLETRIALDPGFLRQDIIILTFKVA